MRLALGRKWSATGVSEMGKKERRFRWHCGEQFTVELSPGRRKIYWRSWADAGSVSVRDAIAAARGEYRDCYHGVCFILSTREVTSCISDILGHTDNKTWSIRVARRVLDHLKVSWRQT